MYQPFHEDRSFIIQCPYCTGHVRVKRVSTLLFDFMVENCRHVDLYGFRIAHDESPVIFFKRPYSWFRRTRENLPLSKQGKLRI